MQWHIVVAALRALGPVIALALASALVARGVQPPRRRGVRGRSSARTIRIVVQTQAGPGSASPAAITKSPARVVRARF